MNRLVSISALAAALLMGGIAPAWAAQPAANDFVAVADQTALPFQTPRPHKSYQFDSKRWGFRVDLDEPSNRQTEWKDVTAGAYFKISPGLRFGGSVGLGDKFAQPQQIAPQDTGPRVHLETKFQF